MLDIAPEIWEQRGKKHQFSLSVDIYALACLFYFLVHRKHAVPAGKGKHFEVAIFLSFSSSNRSGAKGSGTPTHHARLSSRFGRSDSAILA